MLRKSPNPKGVLENAAKDVSKSRGSGGENPVLMATVCLV